jgi:hypothetical protein
MQKAKKTIGKKIQNNPNSKPNVYPDVCPELDLDYFTCGLFKMIPLDSNSVVFTGGLLFDAYYAHVHQTKPNYYLQDLKDIDLFLIGTEENKISITTKIIKNLMLAYGDENVCTSIQHSVISIYIVGIPRIVQLICTNYSKPDEVIDSFDFAHVAMHVTGNGFYASPFAKMAVQLKKVLPNPNCGKRAKLSRLIKYASRGLNISDYVKEFPITNNDASQIRKKSEEKIIFKNTKNLVDINHYNICDFVFFKLNKNLFDISEQTWTTQVNWSGDFRYIQPKENFLHDSNKLDIVSLRVNDNEYYTSLVGKKVIYENQNKAIEANEQMPNETIFVDFIIKAKIKKIIFGPVEINDYKGEWSYHVIWTLVDEEQIDFVKNVIKTGITDLDVQNEFLKFYETGILDSKALSPEEKTIFNVTNFPHGKYANAELTEEINKCAESNEFCLFATIYRERFTIGEVEIPNEEQLGYHEKIKLEYDKFLTDKMDKDVYIVFQVKNFKKGGKNSTLNQETRARTSFMPQQIFDLNC